jgi:hypothetical protein
MGEKYSTHGKINAYGVLVWKLYGKGPLGRARSRQKDSIRMDLKETEWKGVGRFIWFRIETSI